MSSAHEITSTFPKWRSRPNDQENLREISPNLFIGAAFAPRAHVSWDTIIDFYGPSGGAPRFYEYHGRQDIRAGYARARKVHTLPFTDGNTFPPGVLDEVWRACREARGPVLIHCQAGLSRSASAGYAILRRGYGLSHEEARGVVHVQSGYPTETTLLSAREWVRDSR